MFHRLKCLLFALFSSFATSTCIGSISRSEYDALLALYDSADGNQWQWVRSKPPSTVWTFPNALTTPCTKQWQGLSCVTNVHNASECYIASLNLEGYQLNGTITNQLGNLTKLEQLNLASNQLIGLLPTELGQLSDIQQLYLNSNRLTGSIPTELGQLSAMRNLYLNINRLVGSIPTELGHLSAMLELYLYANALVGSIPTELGQLSAMQILFLNINHLVGSIPTELGQLSALQKLYLYENSLDGSIPTELGQLSALQSMYLYFNRLVGSIPTELGQLSTIQIMALGINSLVGLIPTEFGKLSAIQNLYLSVNSLSGSIPSELGQLSTMENLYLNINSLAGSIPTELGQLGAMQILYLNSNNLVGSIPTELGELSALQQLHFYDNSLVGSIPTEFGQLSAMQEFVLYSNSLIGSIPSQLGQMSELQILALNINNLVGSIPTELFYLTTLLSMQLQNNSLSGTLVSLVGMTSLQAFNVSANFMSGIVPSFPASVQYVSLASNHFSSSIATGFASADSMEFLDISDNALTGPIPSYFAGWQLLNILSVSTNLLSQSIESLIFGSGNSSLQSIDASNNVFSGSLPGAFFVQGSLSMVLLSENCFSGSLPSVICDNSRLRTLFLDSLTGNCGSAVPVGLRPVMHASIPKRLMQGGIPSCVWSMGELQLLRLSGNGLTGSLGDIPTDSSLSELVLSSNMLTGSIPSSWQSSGQWSQLDLSSNKFSGVLSDDFVIAADSTLLDLTVNRLSGRLPAVFENVSHPLSVLDGNLFQCQASHLPEQDPAHDGYVCGADDLDTALEFALAVVGLVLIALCAICYNDKWLQPARNVQAKTLSVLRVDVAHLLSVACLQAVVTVVLYSTFKFVDSLQTFSTHSVQYTWTPSAAFLHGWGPVVLVSLLLLITGFLWQINEVLTATQRSASACMVPRCRWQWPEEGVGPATRRLLSYYSVHLMNVIVVVAVNAAYVNAVLEGLSVQKLFAIQVLLSVFKLVWNSLVVPYLVIVGKCETSDHLFMTLFAFIGGPFISTFFTSSNCFRNLYIGESPVQSTTSILQYGCREFCTPYCVDGQCGTLCEFVCGLSGKKTMSLSLTPPWNYSYQCASSLLTNYIPVMIVTFAISGAVLPWLVFTYYSMAARMDGHIIRIVPLRLQKAMMHGTLYAANREQAILLTEGESLIKTSKFRLRHLLHVAVLLTFGIASPLLSVLIGFGAAMQCFLLHVSVGRILDLLLTRQSDVDNDSRRFEDCRSLVLRGLASCEIRKQSIEMRIVMLFAGLFWGFFVFDMMGDVYGSVVGGLSVLAPCGVSLVIVLVGSKMVGSKSIRQISVVMGMEMASVNPMTVDLPQSTDDGFTLDKPLD